MPLTTVLITFVYLLVMSLLAIITDDLITTLVARQTPHWFSGPYNTVCHGLRWFDRLFCVIGNALCQLGNICHGLVSNTRRWFGNFFHGLGNGLCDILIHIRLRYDAKVQEMAERQKHLENEISARDQTINAHEEQNRQGMLAKDAKITQKDEMLAATRKEKDELLEEVSRKDTELADEKALSMGQRAEIRILELKVDVYSGKLPFSHDSLEKSHALGMPEEDKMALGLTLYKKQNNELQRKAKHSERAGDSFKRMVKANEDLRSERNVQLKESLNLRSELDSERAKTAGLEADIAELEKAVDDGVDQNANLCHHQDELREQLGASQDQASELQTTVMKQLQHSGKLQDEVNDAEIRNIDQQRDLLDAQNIVTDTQHQNDRLQDLASDRLKQLHRAETTNSQLQVKIACTENAKNELEGQLIVALKTNTYLESKTHDITNGLNAALKTKTQLLSSVHDIEGRLNGAVKTNAKLRSRFDKDQKEKSKLKTALRKALVKIARLRKKTANGRTSRMQKRTKALAEDKDDGPGSDGDDDDDDDDQGKGNAAPTQPAPSSTSPPSTSPPSTPPPSTPPPSTPSSLSPSCDNAPPSSGNALGPSSDDSIRRPTGSDSSTASSGHPSSSPTQGTPSHLKTPVSPKGNIKALPEDNVARDTSNDEPMALPGLPFPSSAQDTASSSVENLESDGSLGVTVENRETDDASTASVDVSESPSTSPAQDPAPLSLGNSISDGSPSARVGASTVPVGPSENPFLLPAQDATPSSIGKSKNVGSSEATVESREVEGASTVPVGSSENPSQSPAQDLAPSSIGNLMSDGSSGATVESREEDNASTGPIPSSENSFPSPAQNVAPLSARNSMNDKSPGATVESREADDVNTGSVASSDHSSPSSAQDATPLSVGSSMSDGSSGATIEKCEDNNASTMPVESSSPAITTATPKTEASPQSNDTPKPITPLPSTAAECIVDSNLVANSTPSVRDTETSQLNDGSKPIFPPLSHKAEHFVDDHKATTAPSTGNVEASPPNDTSNPTTPLPATRDACLVDIKPVTDSAPLASTVNQAKPIDAALVPLPESPAAFPANSNQSQQSEERLQANYAQHGMPNIDNEELGEGEREDLARERLGWEDNEQKGDEEAIDTPEDNVWNSEDVDMEDSNEEPPVEPANPAAPSNVDSQTNPAPTINSIDSLFEGDDSMDYLFEGDEIDVDRDDEDFYGPDSTKPHEPTPAAGNDSENKPEINVEMGEAGPLDSDPQTPNSQGNVRPVVTPQQAPFVPPSQPAAAPAPAPASTSFAFGTTAPVPGYRFAAVLAKAGGGDTTPASSTKSQMSPGPTPPSQPSQAPLYCPKPAFSTLSWNAPRTSASTPQQAPPFALNLTPEQRQLGPSAYNPYPGPSWSHQGTTPTTPKSGSLFGAVAKSSFNSPSTPTRPRSSSSSSSESESEQPAATGSTSTEGPSTPLTPAVPNGTSGSFQLPGLFQDTPCDYGKKIGTPIESPTNERKFVPLKPRLRRTGPTRPPLPLPAGASTATSNYTTVADSDGTKLVMPKNEDEMEDFYENELAKNEDARESKAAHEAPAEPSNSELPNASSLSSEIPFLPESQVAGLAEMLQTVAQEIVARLRATIWPEARFGPTIPNYNPVEADFRFSREQYMGWTAQRAQSQPPASNTQNGQPPNASSTSNAPQPAQRRVANTPPKKRKAQ